MTGPDIYPVRVTADIDRPLSAAYACLMTDKYPPFRLDMGGHDQGVAAHATPA